MARSVERSGEGRRTPIPDATIARLPIYHRVLAGLAERDVLTVSSDELAAACGITSAKLRKDLSHLGSYGTRGVGYDVEYLRYQIARELGGSQDWPVVIVGVGNLGHALANYRGFATRGFHVVGLVDADPGRLGETVVTAAEGGPSLLVQPVSALHEIVRANAVQIGVIATPAAAAQEVCDRLVAAGVTSILNFAPVVLAVPGGVDVRKVDLALELQILAFHEQRKSADLPAGATVATATVATATAEAGVGA